MVKFTGQIRGKPGRRNGRWCFSIWNKRGSIGINCISSADFEAEHSNGVLGVNPLDQVEVIGNVETPGVICFDSLRKVKTPVR
jgi:hypothetical protein